MGRQLYETEKDLANEAAFFSTIESRFNIKCHKLPISWQMDMLMSKASGCAKWVIGLGEVKCRKHSHDTFPTVICGRHKLQKGLALRDRFLFKVKGSYKRPSLMFFVRFTDGDFFTKVDDLQKFKQQKFTARNHADDPTDTEWVVHIPIDQFKPFVT